MQCGTRVPALKRRAILQCPCGTGRGQTLGCIHHLERPDRAPEPLVAQSSGFLITIRAPCLTQQGDCVAVIAQQVSEQEVMKA